MITEKEEKIKRLLEKENKENDEFLFNMKIIFIYNFVLIFINIFQLRILWFVFLIIFFGFLYIKSWADGFYKHKSEALVEEFLEEKLSLYDVDTVMHVLKKFKEKGISIKRIKIASVFLYFTFINLVMIAIDYNNYFILLLMLVILIIMPILKVKSIKVLNQKIKKININNERDFRELVKEYVLFKGLREK